MPHFYSYRLVIHLSNALQERISYLQINKSTLSHLSLLKFWSLC